MFAFKQAQHDCPNPLSQREPRSVRLRSLFPREQRLCLCHSERRCTLHTMAAQPGPHLPRFTRSMHRRTLVSGYEADDRTHSSELRLLNPWSPTAAPPSPEAGVLSPRAASAASRASALAAATPTKPSLAVATPTSGDHDNTSNETLQEQFTKPGLCSATRRRRRRRQKLRSQCVHCSRVVAGTTPSMLRRHLAACPSLPLWLQHSLDSQAVDDAKAGLGVYGKQRDLYAKYRVIGLRKSVHTECGAVVRGGTAELSAHASSCAAVRGPEATPQAHAAARCKRKLQYPPPPTSKCAQALPVTEDGGGHGQDEQLRWAATVLWQMKVTTPVESADLDLAHSLKLRRMAVAVRNVIACERQPCVSPKQQAGCSLSAFKL